MTGGDFVRNVKQLVDLLRQIATIEHPSRLSSVAAAAADALVRGIVAASSGVPGVSLRSAGVHEHGRAVP